jgi:hypothetical protein
MTELETPMPLETAYNAHQAPMARSGCLPGFPGWHAVTRLGTACFAIPCSQPRPFGLWHLLGVVALAAQVATATSRPNPTQS